MENVETVGGLHGFAVRLFRRQLERLRRELRIRLQQRVSGEPRELAGTLDGKLELAGGLREVGALLVDLLIELIRAVRQFLQHIEALLALELLLLFIEREIDEADLALFVALQVGFVRVVILRDVLVCHLHVLRDLVVTQTHNRDIELSVGAFVLLFGLCLRHLHAERDEVFDLLQSDRVTREFFELRIVEA